jgi:hypothetical protein
MPTEIKVWEIGQGELVEADQKAFGEHHTEAELEDWITRKPDPLGENLLIIGRQKEAQELVQELRALVAPAHS